MSIDQHEANRLAKLVGSTDLRHGYKIKSYMGRNQKQNGDLYKIPDELNGIDFVTCPVLGTRMLNIKKYYIENILLMTVGEFKQKFPNVKMICPAQAKKIKSALAVEVDGVTRHAQSVVKATEARAVVGEDGLTINARKGRKTRQTHMQIGEDGLNGYQRIAAVARPKQIETMAKSGRRVSGKDKNTWDYYRNFVNWLTCPLKDEVLEGKKTGKMGTIGAYQVDHKYAVITGFKNRVSPFLIASRENLESIRWEDNALKKTNGSLNLDELFRKSGYNIEQSEQEYFQFSSILTDLINEKRNISSAVINAKILQHREEKASKQKVTLNSNRYEILTPYGWEDFEGVVQTMMSGDGFRLVTKSFRVTATQEHKFFSHGKEKRVLDFQIGDFLDTEYGFEMITEIIPVKLEKNYEILNSKSHTIYANGIASHQCDEFAFVAPGKQKEFFTSVIPTLSTGGSCIITSTPRTDEDQFAHIWKGAIDSTDEFGNPNENGLGKNGWYAFKAIWTDHPDRDEEWARPIRETLGEARFLQENAGEFLSDEETLINPMALQRISNHTIDPLFYVGTTRWFAEPKPNRAYLVTLDPATGTATSLSGGDSAAIQVFQLGAELTQVAEWSHNKTPARGQVLILRQTLLWLDQELRAMDDQMGEPEIYWTFENNGVGKAVAQVIEDTGEERFPGHLVSDKKGRMANKGMFTSRNKVAECARLKSLIESDRMKIKSKNLVKELKFFVAFANSFQAKTGEHDDLVSATILVVRLMDYVIRWADKHNDELREYIDDDEIMQNEPMPFVV